MGDAEVAECLYEQQGGKCALCGVGFPLRNLETDHIQPKRNDKIENLQLLCGACNKGDRPQGWAIGRLGELGVVG